MMFTKEAFDKIVAEFETAAAVRALRDTDNHNAISDQADAIAAAQKRVEQSATDLAIANGNLAEARATLVDYVTQMANEVKP